MKRRRRINAAKTRRRKPPTIKRQRTTASHNRSGSKFERNKQLSRELDEAREQQAATADVLNVISRSMFDLQTVFDTLVESATRLCQASASNIWRPAGDGRYHVVASYGVPPKFKNYLEALALKPDGHSVVGRCLRAGKTVYVPDLMADPEYTKRQVVEFGGYRGLLCVPLLREGAPIGVLMVAHTSERKFSLPQIALATTFADQAVIAIENTRLLNELRQRTDDLSEALDQQTATSEVLKVISHSSGQLEPVFESMLANATRICEAAFGSMLLVEGDALRRVALHNAPPLFVEFNTKNPLIPLGQVHDLNLLFETRRPVHIADAAGTEDSPIVKYGGARTLVIVPMLKDRDVVGVIGIYRQEVRAFTDKQIELVTNFAAQAVIAIENARLLNELRESLQQQTATADVLKVISSSPGDLGPVFGAMLANAVRICEAKFGVMWRFEGEENYPVAMLNLPPSVDEFLRQRGHRKPTLGSDLDVLRES